MNRTMVPKINTLVLATGNMGKIKELCELLSPIQCIPQQQFSIPEAEETGLSFIENAIIKARHASLLSGHPALADDSGLVVAALQGQPGIYSARYAHPAARDEENIQYLLKQLKQTPPESRQAYFYCAIALVVHAQDPTPIISTSRLDGYITNTRVGEYGFGYDPIFYVPEYQCTLAEISLDQKNRISHRAKALIDIKSILL